MTRSFVVGMWVAVLCLVLVQSATASARYPGERVITESRVPAQIDLALTYWAGYGLTGCPNGINSYWVDDLRDTDGVDAAGRATTDGSCNLWLKAPTIYGLREWQGPVMGREMQRWNSERECALIFHEVGHNLGLHHTATGLMAPVIDLAFAPKPCVDIARPRRVLRLRTRPNRNRHTGMGTIRSRGRF